MKENFVTVKVKVFENSYQDLYRDLLTTPERQRAEKIRKLCILGYLTKNHYPANVTGSQTMEMTLSNPSTFNESMFSAFDDE